MNDDRAIGDNPFEHNPDAHQPRRPFTVEDVLDSARLVERTASICLRADMVAEHDRILEELGTLITPSGELVEGDEENGLDQQSNASRARYLADRLQRVQQEMRSSMWHVRFRAMPSDEWTTFKRLWWPKGKDPDLTEFRTKLVAACAVEPPITEAQVKELRKKLTASQIVKLSDTAYDACTAGGLDVPKSPTSWANLAQQ